MRRQTGGITRVIALTIAGILIIGAIVAGLFPLIASGECAYGFEMSLFGAGVAVEQSVIYTNDTGGALDAVMFALGANAYRRSITAPVSDSDFEDAYPSSFMPGGVELYSVLVDGESAGFGVSGAGETSLRVEAALAPGETREFTFRYDVVPPESRLPLGANDGEIRLSCFYPMIGAYDESARAHSQYPPSALRGTAFSDPADYTVELSVPDGFTIAAPGKVEKTENGFRVTLKNARDLSLIIKKSASERAGEDAAGNRVSVSATDIFATGRALTYAVRALDFCAEKFGRFPGDGIVISAADVIDARAYSGIVVIPAGLFRFSERYRLERAIMNGVARQYFGISSMNDPEKSPWIDEAICAYAELCYVESVYGRKAFLSALNDIALDALNVTVPGYVHVDSELSYFSSKQEYRLMVEGRGVAIMHVLREMTGDKVFFDALGLYFGGGAGGVADAEDFADAVRDAGGGDTRELLDDLLLSIGDYVNQNLEQFGG